MLDVPATFPRDKRILAELGIQLAREFCCANGLPAPAVHVTPAAEWHVSTCAYYRPDTPAARKWTRPGIHICLEYCGTPCGEAPGRNWTWPGSAVDREPYGVVCHELGHHCDWLAGARKGSYFSDYGVRLQADVKEAGVSNYADTNPAEFTAEAMRLYITNPELLRLLRPRTWAALDRRWYAVRPYDWQACLGSNAPGRVLRANRNKMRR